MLIIVTASSHEPEHLGARVPNGKHDHLNTNEENSNIVML